MRIKQRELVIWVYFAILALGIAYIIMGNYLTHYWEFGLEKAILFVGNYTLSPSELDLLFAVFCISLSFSLIYHATSIQKKIKTFLFAIALVFAVFLYVFPEVATILVVWPIMVTDSFVNLGGISLGSDFVTMSILTIFTVAIHSCAIKVLKRVRARLVLQENEN